MSEEVGARSQGANSLTVSKQNQDCCGEFLLTKSSHVRPVSSGEMTRPDATKSGALALPDKPNLTEVSGAMWRGRPRSFYLSFTNPADQRKFIEVVQNNIRFVSD